MDFDDSWLLGVNRLVDIDRAVFANICSISSPASSIIGYSHLFSMFDPVVLHVTVTNYDAKATSKVLVRFQLLTHFLGMSL